MKLCEDDQDLFVQKPIVCVCVFVLQVEKNVVNIMLRLKNH